MDVDGDRADQAVMPERRTWWVLVLGRCNLALFGVWAAVTALFALSVGDGAFLEFMPIALGAAALCAGWVTLLRGVERGSRRARWALALLVLVQLLAAAVVQLAIGEFNHLITTWLIVEVVLFGLLVS